MKIVNDYHWNIDYTKLRRTLRSMASDLDMPMNEFANFTDCPEVTKQIMYDTKGNVYNDDNHILMRNFLGICNSLELRPLDFFKVVRQ